MRAKRATMFWGCLLVICRAFFVGVWVWVWVLVVSWCWLVVGELICNDLVTIWCFWLFGVVFGLWLCNDCFVIIRGHFREEVVKCQKLCLFRLALIFQNR
jgi:hypothetical protein